MRKSVFIVAILITAAVGVAIFYFWPKNGAPENNKMNGLKIEIMKEGSGDGAKPGNVVFVNYTGWLANGQKFDSSLDRGAPFSFKLGAGSVIKGWEEGILGMKVGEKRRLTISSELGYGARGAGNLIPPGATLIFEVEMLEIK